ncbi:MAG: c-type cytochrome [Gemmatimonadota bacterium]|jgi:mono/diheme cytochrome c family protein
MKAGVLVPLVLVISACGGSDGGSAGSGSAPAATPSSSAGSELTAEQLEKGIGPVTSVTLGEAIDEALATQGEEVFTLKCSACHKLEARYVGPQLGGVLDRRTPEFVMNMILNPAEMVAKHPETKKLLGEFMLAMPNQNVTQDEARAVLEYIRSWKQP